MLFDAVILRRSHRTARCLVRTLSRLRRRPLSASCSVASALPATQGPEASPHEVVGALEWKPGITFSVNYEPGFCVSVLSDKGLVLIEAVANAAEYLG